MAFVGNDIYDSILLEFSKEKKQVDRIKKEIKLLPFEAFSG